jgi:enoyl-[acyl-carrier protein] reductase II
VIEEEVPIIFTSAGNPATWTSKLKEQKRIVVHVVSSVRFAQKAEQCGVDAVVAEGFEAGGHNGREETTSFVLFPMVREAISIPLIGAGGISSGRTMLAAEILGADGVQIGSRFAVSDESSAHINFKQKVISAIEGDTVLTLKQLTPVRLIKNKFYQHVRQAEEKGATKDELIQLLGNRRSKRGIFEGDLEDGELEIGQVSAMLRSIEPAAKIVEDIWNEYLSLKKNYFDEVS